MLVYWGSVAGNLFTVLAVFAVAGSIAYITAGLKKGVCVRVTLNT